MEVQLIRQSPTAQSLAFSYVNIAGRGISSNGRALALHARSNGFDTRILQVNFYLGTAMAEGVTKVFADLFCKPFVEAGSPKEDEKG